MRHFFTATSLYSNYNAIRADVKHNVKKRQGSGVMAYRGDIAVSDARKTIGALLELTLFENNVSGIVDYYRGPVVVLLETKLAVDKTDVPYVAKVECVRWYGPYATRKSLIVFRRVRQCLQSSPTTLGCDSDIFKLDVLDWTSRLSPDNRWHLALFEI